MPHPRHAPAVLPPMTEHALIDELNRRINIGVANLRRHQAATRRHPRPKPPKSPAPDPRQLALFSSTPKE